jgi:hypothetical protein
VSEANQFHPAHRRGAVAAVSELAEDRVPMFGEKTTESRDFHAVDSGCSTVLLHSFPSGVQVFTGQNLFL